MRQYPSHTKLTLEGLGSYYKTLNVPTDGGCSAAPWPVSSSEWPGSRVLPAAGLAVSEFCSNYNRLRNGTLLHEPAVMV